MYRCIVFYNEKRLYINYDKTSTQYNPLRSHSERDKRNRRHSYSMRYICQRRPSVQRQSTIDNDHIDRQPAQNWHILYIDIISGGKDGRYRRKRSYTHNRRPTGETIHHLSQRPVTGDGPTSSVTTSPTRTDHFPIIRFNRTFFYVEIYPAKGMQRLGKLGKIKITHTLPYTQYGQHGRTEYSTRKFRRKFWNSRCIWQQYIILPKQILRSQNQILETINIYGPRHRKLTIFFWKIKMNGAHAIDISDDTTTRTIWFLLLPA